MWYIITLKYMYTLLAISENGIRRHYVFQLYCNSVNNASSVHMLTYISIVHWYDHNYSIY